MLFLALLLMLLLQMLGIRIVCHFFVVVVHSLEFTHSVNYFQLQKLICRIFDIIRWSYFLFHCSVILSIYNIEYIFSLPQFISIFIEWSISKREMRIKMQVRNTWNCKITKCIKVNTTEMKTLHFDWSWFLSGVNMEVFGHFLFTGIEQFACSHFDNI